MIKKKAIIHLKFRYKLIIYKYFIKIRYKFYFIYNFYYKKDF
jgi:hypothetical protein